MKEIKNHLLEERCPGSRMARFKHNEEEKPAAALPEGASMEIVQSFDPIPLYEVMEDLGFEYHTEQKADAEYHAYFYRTRVKQEEKAIPDPLHSTIDLPENVSGQCIIYILRNIIGM